MYYSRINKEQLNVCIITLSRGVSVNSNSSKACL